MGFTKHTNAEEVEVLTPEEHQGIEEGLHSIGKTSAATLTIDERKVVLEHSDEDDTGN